MSSDKAVEVIYADFFKMFHPAKSCNVSSTKMKKKSFYCFEKEGRHLLFIIWGSDLLNGYWHLGRLRGGRGWDGMGWVDEVGRLGGMGWVDYGGEGWTGNDTYSLLFPVLSQVHV